MLAQTSVGYTVSPETLAFAPQKLNHHQTKVNPFQDLKTPSLKEFCLHKHTEWSERCIITEDGGGKNNLFPVQTASSVSEPFETSGHRGRLQPG